MSAAIPCTPCCSTPQSVDIPGPEGDAGSNGLDGENSFTQSTADFVIPAIGDTVLVPVVSSLWMVEGQVVVFAGPASFQVISLPSSTSVELEFLGYALDLSPGATITAGTQVSPGGTQPFQVLTASAALNFPDTATQTSEDLTVNVPGAAVGDAIALGVPIAAVNDDTCYTAFVSAADTVTVRHNNYSSGSVNPASAAFLIVVFKV